MKTVITTTSLLMLSPISCRKDVPKPIQSTACFALEKSTFEVNEWIRVYNCASFEQFQSYFLYQGEEKPDSFNQIHLQTFAELDSFRVSTAGVYRLHATASSGDPGSRVDDFFEAIVVE